MGDMADYYIALALDAGEGYRSDLQKQARCKHCGSAAVAWVHTGVRWRLYDAGMKNPHRCGRVADANDFEDATDA